MRKILVPAVLFLLMWTLPAAAAVAVDVKVSVPLPRIVIKAEPVLVVVPGTYVYAAPDVDADLVFYQGFWYRPYGGHWYRSDDYNGRWVAVPDHGVPVAVSKLPPNWKRVPPGHERMPYGHVKSNWSSWERDRHWERAERRRGGSREGRVEERSVKTKGREYDDDRGRKHKEKEKKGKGKGKRDHDEYDDERTERPGPPPYRR